MLVSRGHTPILVAFSAAVLVATMGVTPALAAVIWTIQPGGVIAATSGRATFTDTRSEASFPCESVSATGTLHSGTGLSGADAGSISAVGFHTCTSPALVFSPRLVFQVRAGDLPWGLSLSSYRAGVVTGSIRHIQISVTTTACHFVIDGTAAAASNGVITFRYSDSTGKLTTTGGNLHAYNVQGCFGIIRTGDPLTVSATFTLSPKQTIISP
jgi:hypothetical protein